MKKHYVGLVFALLFLFTSCNEERSLIKNENSIENVSNESLNNVEDIEVEKRNCIVKIDNKLKEADSQTRVALSYINSQSQAYPGNIQKIYEAIISRKVNFDNAKLSLNEALKLSQMYEDFYEVETAIQKAIDSFPKLPDNNLTSIQTFLDNYSLYIVDFASAQLEVVYMK